MTASHQEKGQGVLGKRLLFVTGTRADYGKLERLRRLVFTSRFSSPGCI